MESTGRVSAFDSIFSLDYLDVKSLNLPNTAIRTSVINIQNFHNKDSLSYNEVDADIQEAKGGPNDQGDLDYTDISTTGDDSLIPGLASLTTVASENDRSETIIYKVEQGDTISKIAAEFGVTINTVLWANNLNSLSYIKEGQELKILPVTGIQHDVKKGDTIVAIAKKYKVKKEDIITFNSLSLDGALQLGEILIIPDGEMPIVYAVAKTKTVVTYSKSTVNADSYFIFPAKGVRSQGVHGYNGVDVANKCGSPIYSAADGLVATALTTKSRSKFGATVFGGYGNHVKITHPNGTATLYAHMKDISVESGQFVKKGQEIGSMGGGFEYVNGKLFRMQGSGKSTGCHLHFEVRGANNPLAKYRSY